MNGPILRCSIDDCQWVECRPMQIGAHAVATDLEIRPFRDEDWPAVHAIYTQGIATGNATFETEVPAFDRWSATHPAEYRFVAERAGEVTGWVAASPVSERCAYAGVLENSVYVATGMHGQGPG